MNKFTKILIMAVISASLCAGAALLRAASPCSGSTVVSCNDKGEKPGNGHSCRKAKERGNHSCKNRETWKKRCCKESCQVKTGCKAGTGKVACRGENGAMEKGHRHSCKAKDGCPARDEKETGECRDAPKHDDKGEARKGS